MAYPLYIVTPQLTQTGIWRNFIKCVLDRTSKRMTVPHTDDMYIILYEEERNAGLAVYGAWTDWESMKDPLWFPNEESRAAFVLAYS